MGHEKEGWFTSKDFTAADQSAADTAGDYFFFTVKANSGYFLNLTSIDFIAERENGAGPTKIQVAYGIGTGLTTPTTFVDSALSFSGDTFNTFTNPGTEFDFSAISALQNVNSSQTVTIGIYAWEPGKSGSDKWFGLGDGKGVVSTDLRLNGTSLIPEPSTYALIFGVFAIIVVAAKRRFVKKQGSRDVETD